MTRVSVVDALMGLLLFKVKQQERKMSGYSKASKYQMENGRTKNGGWPEVEEETYGLLSGHHDWRLEAALAKWTAKNPNSEKYI